MKRIFPAVLALALLLCACAAQPEPAPTPEPTPEPTPTHTPVPTPAPIPPEQWEALFQQELLFIQQGLRQHGVDEEFTVYFGQPDDGLPGAHTLLLCDNDHAWEEVLTYSYTESDNWYCFVPSYEPVLTQDEWNRDSLDKWADFRDDAVYHANLSADMDLTAPIRFDIPPGPVITDERRDDGDYGPGPWLYQYRYLDQRLDFSATIEYPQYSTYQSKYQHVEQINQLLKDATFYGYLDEDHLEYEMNGFITRTCTVTRADEHYVSARWYEYNCFRGANHPNDWWLGILIDLETGKALTLADIVSQDVLEQALDDGTFRCEQIYVDGPNQDEEANRARLDAVKEYLDMHQTDNFYLTDDALGLCGGIGRYSFYLEAPLSELGLSQWMQTGS